MTHIMPQKISDGWLEWAVFVVMISLMVCDVFKGDFETGGQRQRVKVNAFDIERHIVNFHQRIAQELVG